MELLKNNNASLFPPRAPQDRQFKNMYDGCGGDPPMDCDQRFTNLETRLGGLETRLDKVESRLDGVETRLLGVENRLVTVEIGLENVKGEVKQLSHNVHSYLKWLTGLVATLIVAILGVWYLIDQRQESWIQHSASQIQSASQSFLESANAANRALLDQIDARHNLRHENLQRQIDRIERNLE